MKNELYEEKEGLKDILEEAEILAELKEEERIRKKNTKVIAMAVVGVVICVVIFFWTQLVPQEKAAITDEAPPPVVEDVFPEAGKIKLPDEPVQEMKAIREPLASDEDTPSAPEPIIKAVEPPVVPEKSVAVVERQVKKTEKPKKTAKEAGIFNIRVGAFVLSSELKQATDQVKALGLSAITKKEKNKVEMHKVLVGPYPSRTGAEKAQTQLQAKGTKGFVTEAENQYFVGVGSFYKKEGALDMKGKMEKLGFPSRPIFEPTELLCDTLYATNKGTAEEAEKMLRLLKSKGFQGAVMLQ